MAAGCHKRIVQVLMGRAGLTRPLGNFGRTFSAIAEQPAPAATASVSQTPQIPDFDYTPRPYSGPSAAEVLEKRKKYLNPAIFYYYKKPVLCVRRSIIHML